MKSRVVPSSPTSITGGANLLAIAAACEANLPQTCLSSCPGPAILNKRAATVGRPYCLDKMLETCSAASLLAEYISIGRHGALSCNGRSLSLTIPYTPPLEQITSLRRVMAELETA